jgi:hypothetical protein
MRKNPYGIKLSCFELTTQIESNEIFQEIRDSGDLFYQQTNEPSYSLVFQNSDESLKEKYYKLSKQSFYNRNSVKLSQPISSKTDNYRFLPYLVQYRRNFALYHYQAPELLPLETSKYYVVPEQSSDIYSLTLLLWECLNFCVPFIVHTELELQEMYGQNKAILPVFLKERCEKFLELFDQGLKVKSGERLGDIAGFLAMLEQAKLACFSENMKDVLIDFEDEQEMEIPRGKIYEKVRIGGERLGDPQKRRENVISMEELSARADESNRYSESCKSSEIEPNLVQDSPGILRDDPLKYIRPTPPKKPARKRRESPVLDRTDSTMYRSFLDFQLNTPKATEEGIYERTSTLKKRLKGTMSEPRKSAKELFGYQDQVQDPGFEKINNELNQLCSEINQSEFLREAYKEDQEKIWDDQNARKIQKIADSKKILESQAKNVENIRNIQNTWKSRVAGVPQKSPVNIEVKGCAKFHKNQENFMRNRENLDESKKNSPESAGKYRKWRENLGKNQGSSEKSGRSLETPKKSPGQTLDSGINTWTPKKFPSIYPKYTVNSDGIIRTPGSSKKSGDTRKSKESPSRSFEQLSGEEKIGKMDSPSQHSLNNSYRFTIGDFSLPKTPIARSSKLLRNAWLQDKKSPSPGKFEKAERPLSDIQKKETNDLDYPGVSRSADSRKQYNVNINIKRGNAASMSHLNHSMDSINVSYRVPHESMEEINKKYYPNMPELLSDAIQKQREKSFLNWSLRRDERFEKSLWGRELEKCAPKPKEVLIERPKSVKETVKFLETLSPAPGNQKPLGWIRKDKAEAQLTNNRDSLDECMQKAHESINKLCNLFQEQNLVSETGKNDLNRRLDFDDSIFNASEVQEPQNFQKIEEEKADLIQEASREENQNFGGKLVQEISEEKPQSGQENSDDENQKNGHEEIHQKFQENEDPMEALQERQNSNESLNQETVELTRQYSQDSLDNQEPGTSSPPIILVEKTPSKPTPKKKITTKVTVNFKKISRRSSDVGLDLTKKQQLLKQIACDGDPTRHSICSSNEFLQRISSHLKSEEEGASGQALVAAERNSELTGSLRAKYFCRNCGFTMIPDRLQQSE